MCCLTHLAYVTKWREKTENTKQPLQTTPRYDGVTALNHAINIVMLELALLEETYN